MIEKEKKAEQAPAEEKVSGEKARRKAHVANYAKANPVKYEGKKAALEKWINEA